MGSPGSFKFFRDATLTSSPVLVVIFVHELKFDAPTARQKLHVILCANFSMLFLPANVATPTASTIIITLLSLTFGEKEKKILGGNV